MHHTCITYVYQQKPRHFRYPPFFSLTTTTTKYQNQRSTQYPNQNDTGDLLDHPIESQEVSTREKVHTSKNSKIMISQTSSLVMRWASGMIRERFAAVSTSLFSAPIFVHGMNHNLALLSPCGEQLAPPAADLQQHIWFAVPKSKISRSRKRMKTTRQKRIPLKKNIVFDPRTGEVTLKHKMPFNWKEYIPKDE